MGCFQNLVAQAAQGADGKMPDPNFVFEDEDCFGAGRQFASRWSSIGRGRRSRDPREKDVEWGAAARVTLCADLTPALPDDAVARGEAEAAVPSRVFGCKEGLKYFFMQFNELVDSRIIFIRTYK